MSKEIHFRNRAEGGKRLAALFRHHAEDPTAIVVGLARGGVVTAFEVAKALDLPLEVLVVRKLAAPGEDKLTIGALASGGIRAINDELVETLKIAPFQIDDAVKREQKEVERLEALFRPHRPPIDCRGKTVILVDDGLATGSTLRAAVEAIRRQQPKRIVVAIPVGPAATIERFAGGADEIVCLATPEPFEAIGVW